MRELTLASMRAGVSAGGSPLRLFSGRKRCQRAGENMLYLVTYGWYEDNRPTIVEGPEVPDWQAFCDSLLEKAAERAIVAAHPGDSWVGWDSITEQIVSELEASGYRVLTPPEAGYWGTSIIDSDEDGEKLPESIRARVIAHNNGVREGLRRDLADRRAANG